MKKIIYIIFALCLSACGDSNKVIENNENPVILAFGDSLTFGYGAVPSESYPAHLSRLIEADVINAGISGETSSEGLVRLASLLDEHQPQLLVLCHGANDMLRRENLEVMQQNLSEMITMAEIRDIDVILISVPKASISMPDMPQYRALADKHAIPLQNDVIREVLSKANLRSDPIHPNGKGYSHIADAVYKLIEKHAFLQ